MQRLRPLEERARDAAQRQKQLEDDNRRLRAAVAAASAGPSSARSQGSASGGAGAAAAAAATELAKVRADLAAALSRAEAAEQRAGRGQDEAVLRQKLAGAEAAASQKAAEAARLEEENQCAIPPRATLPLDPLATCFERSLRERGATCRGMLLRARLGPCPRYLKMELEAFDPAFFDEVFEMKRSYQKQARRRGSHPGAACSDDVRTTGGVQCVILNLGVLIFVQVVVLDEYERKLSEYAKRLGEAFAPLAR